MSAPGINPQLTTKLAAVLEGTAESVVQSVNSLPDVAAKTSGGELVSMTHDELLATITAQHTVTRGAIGDAAAGQRILLVMPATDAVTLSSIISTTPADTIEERRQAGTIGGEEFEAFGEIAKTVCSGLDERLRADLDASVSVKFENTGLIAPNQDDDDLLGNERFVAIKFAWTINDFPSDDAYLLVSWKTAEAWNGGPISDADGAQSPMFADMIEAEVEHRGVIACYLADSEPYHLVRRAARRAGLDLDNRPAAEVPNPATYRGRVVLIDVPLRNEKRFHWCKRLKEYEPSCRVVLMVRHPSRQRIVLGFLSKADVIIGWPLSEEDLFDKLNSLFDEAEIKPEG